ncbi:acyl-CoA ligase (AMP-forming), exosortase A system-associated [Chromobacterium paludis]|uniref:Acyl-CoA ligase (AMP-forming), exosortase A system-associated n=1 Tax=Chromobacterium paludis TaxID=2605945 RepID=A0A5C1DGV5_9NEIS|nr:acyl-CoA ligase (AMP-forming), exosortase A system-associated [Chromobacterium paludis]QEL54798.1 acyl-CoA ligase (AMP-forming), exosortase A system-associated [Chromobacterium paludis]
MNRARISLYHLLRLSAERHGERPAFAQGETRASYAQLLADVRRHAARLAAADIQPGDRVAVYAGKQYDTVAMMLAVNARGAILVPVNPQLKPAQLRHILADSGARLLVSTGARLARLAEALDGLALQCWKLEALPDAMLDAAEPEATDNDPAAILYTSGSTGRPKGVVLSQRNLVSGADSVSAYLGLAEDDVILGILPLSFDAGFSQLTTALASAACYAPLDFLQPKEVPAFCERHGVTAITGVPPLWMQLMAAHWPAATGARVRRFANTGGHMPGPLLDKLRLAFPQAQPYLMYGLTEAFRSTYLQPEDAAARPGSIGKAVPNADIRVLRPDGAECAPGEPGELVHRGAFVTLGYWNDPELTAHRFRPWQGPHGQIPRQEAAVWSGDIVYRDEEGYLYFVARGDDMIKTSGYRVSPTEVEEILFALPGVHEAAAYGVPHPMLGEAIAVSLHGADGVAEAELLALCRERLPSYMVPQRLSFHAEPLPRNPNGKIDRKQLKQQFAGLFADSPTHTG